MKTQSNTVQLESFRFIKVQDFFNESGNEPWQKLKGTTDMKFNKTHKRLDVSFVNADGSACTLLLYFLSDSIIRKRFHPGLASAADYPLGNKRTVVMDSVNDLAATFDKFQVNFTRTDTGATIKTSANGQDTLWL